MELLRMTGEGVQVGELNAEDVAKLVGKPSFSIMLPDERVVVLLGLTRDEARACVPGFLNPARITVSAA